MLRLLGALLIAVCGLGAPAYANSQGAPWGSADPDTLQSCAACHFDHEPVGRSPSLMLTGLPEYVAAGETYEITLRFDVGDASNAGFLLSASAGAFEAIDEFVETKDAEARSAKPATPRNGVASWSFVWRVGADASDVVTFRAAANAANNDQSPFGDKIHFRKFEALTRIDEN